MDVGIPGTFTFELKILILGFEFGHTWHFLLDLDTSGRCAVIPTFEKSIISWIPDDDAANDLQSYNLGGASNAACPLCF